MKILHRYMIKQFIVPFVGMFLLAVFVLLMQFLWKYIDDLIGKGLEFSIIAELFIYFTPHVASVFAFPLAVLMASIFTLANLGENYELIALKAAGISLQRILFPLIVAAIIISVSAFLVANYVTPGAYLKWRTLLHDISQLRPQLHIPEGAFYNGIDGYSFRIGRRDHRTNMMYDVRIYDHRGRAGNVHVILADSGRMMATADNRFLEVELFNGHSYQDIIEEADRRRPLQERRFPFRKDFFEKQVFRMELPQFDLERSDVDIFRDGVQMLNLFQLNYMIDSLSRIIQSQEERLRNIVKPLYSGHNLYSFPFDTTQREKIPENFRQHFNELSKPTRQWTVNEALNSARAQQDQMIGFIYELDNINRRTWRFKIAWHQKLAIPFACFVLLFIGAPLGAIIRKGGVGTPIVIAIIFYVFYYVIDMIGQKAARTGTLTPFEGVWMAAFIILAIGAFLTWMATRDSPIFNIETYTNYIRKGLEYVFVTHQASRPKLTYIATSTDLDPENMIFKIEELSQLCRTYLEGDLRKRLRLITIWTSQENSELVEIAERYDHIRAIIKQSDVDMIRETAEEYPDAALHDFKIKKTSLWQQLATAVVFPAWFYLYLKASVQKNSLRNELRNIIGANRNLVNELNSIL